MSFDSSRSRSANSNGKSKRSFNSNSSARTDDSGRKKQKTNQKTLGMAWGANSLSSSKSSSRKSPFTNFGSYMVEKNRKLRDQFAAEASSSSLGDSNSGKSLFHGVSIFVDGFTVPSSQELKGYMLKYGGRFENYFSRHRVTHIVCSNLPDSKIKNLRSFSGGLPVVKPTWLLDSIAANRLLSWVPYQLEQLANETRKQQKLSAFFPKRNIVSENSETPTNCCSNIELEDPLLMGDTSKGALLPEVGESTKDISQCSGESVFENGNHVEVMEDDAAAAEKSFELKTSEPSSTDMEDENSIGEAHLPSPCRPSSSGSNYCLDKGSPNSRTEGPSNMCHSTLGDPNFVENYFKYSRLHFIGTWRNRYRKRFPCLPGGDKYGKRHAIAPVASQRTSIIHLDMDCFFVSVVIRNHPELRDKPVAVCHSDNPRGTAEISSANYPARDYGVKAGIFVRDAKAHCPHLIILPYNFEAYEEVADQFYDILHKHCNKVQAVSCDEAFLDVTDVEDGDPERLASTIRLEIVETTGCTASAGIAENMLMARLATRTAKPNGQCYIPHDKVDDYLRELSIKVLPGIGHVLEEKLKKRHIQTCGQLRMISKESLQKDFGAKTGDMLWNYSRGIDNRMVGVVQETKSIGADVNWGVRFNDLKDSQHFLVNLCKEVSLRLQGCELQGRTITLKVKKRRKDAEEPTKYMGCGDCENLSHSMTLPISTDDVDVLRRISKQLLGSLHIDVKEIRGIGLQVSKLENANSSKQGNAKNALKSWLFSASAITEERHNASSLTKKRVDGDNGVQSVDESSRKLINSTGSSYVHANQSRGTCLNQVSALPPICHLDRGVIESLPPEIFSEVNEMYGGKLVDFMETNKDKCGSLSGSMCTTSQVEGAGNKGKRPLSPNVVHLRSVTAEGMSSDPEVGVLGRDITKKLPLPSPETEKVRQNTFQEIQSLAVSMSGSSNLNMTTVGADRVDLMPASLSQIDISVLQQLPEELKVDILELLPAHRIPECSSDATLDPPREYCHDTVRMKSNENHLKGSESASENGIWAGNPPKWVAKFKASSCLILNTFSKIYYSSGMTGLLSPILQRAVSLPSLSLDASRDVWDEAICSFSELLKQYIKLKIESDIEEIYICFRFLRRFTMKSRFFLQVYDTVLPFLQSSINEHYGGYLHISNAE
ncbi:DNA repair protein REV1 isoform X4 [Telopea speciosissima]|uniref:DNA repair protein REV1 isoform X4 n=1 Tax=Telopea speciosissima TaxID=54955 RepID=UPI001CC70712|nr:DNA repair protein REV1 isoform X4 [Telopea speciosissima]